MHLPSCFFSRPQGKESTQFDTALGYHGPEEVIHRDNIALVLDGDHEDGGLPGGAEPHDVSREQSGVGPGPAGAPVEVADPEYIC